jgi:lysyl-tRNA synthetase class 2
MAARDIFKKRSELSTSIRSYFLKNGYLEVDTPLLSPVLIPEANIEIFASQYIQPDGETREFYLIPSPELWMKRLLALDTGSIFQISHCFRNFESLGAHHNPEFTMLEYYSVGADYRKSMEITEGLFLHLLDELSLAPLLTYQNQAIDLKPPFVRLSISEVFKRYAAIDLAECLADGRGAGMETCSSDPAPRQLKKIAAAARAKGIAVSSKDTWEIIFHKIFLTLVEPSLPPDKPVFLFDYPQLLSTLAKQNGTAPFAQRWELYIAGLELANCYTEETDGSLIDSFIEKENRKKGSARIPHRPDRALSSFFKTEYPECSGVALGIDRLLMLFLDQRNISGVIFFPFSAMLK